VRGVDGASWNNKRLDFVTFSLQVRNTIVESHIDEASNILANDPTGLEFRYNSKHFRPEETLIFLALSLPGAGKRLARESAANKVNWFKVMLSNFSDIPMPLYVRPMLRQDFVAEIVNFDLPLAGHSGSFQAKIEAAYSSKERAESHPLKNLPLF